MCETVLRDESCEGAGLSGAFAALDFLPTVSVSAYAVSVIHTYLSC